MSQPSFRETMNEVHRLFEEGELAASLDASRSLGTRLLDGPIIDAEQLGWALYYQFRNLHALAEEEAAWALLHSDEMALGQVAPKSEAWMWSVASELAANAGRADDVLRCGEACLVRRYATGDAVGQKQCCETVCALLSRIGAAQRNREFALHLVALGREHEAAVPVRSGIRFLLEALQAGSERARDDLRGALGQLAWIDSALATHDELLAQVEAALGEPVARSHDRSLLRGPACGINPYDPTPNLQARAFAETIRSRDRDEPYTIWGFNRFATLLRLGFSKVGYNAYQLDDGAMYWITDEHAAAIGACLSPALRELHLALTCFEGRGFSLMSETVSDEVSLDKLVINHRSGDEVTVAEATGLARFATAVRAKQLSLWACEYEPEALQAFTDELLRLDNGHLIELDVCDTSLAEPDDRIVLPRLDAMLARNAEA